MGRRADLVQRQALQGHEPAGRYERGERHLYRDRERPAEPQGVAVVDGATYVSTKTGLDKLVDANGDGFFEGRDRLTSWPYANTFHEFAFGLPYRDGYFYVALASALDRAGVTLVPQPSAERGTIAKVNKDTGAVQYIAGGLRTPNGINWGPNGKLLVTDNQGGWVPTSKLVQIEEGGFYNTPTTWADPVTGAMVNGRFDNQPVTPPVVWMPHGEISNSPSTPVVMEEGLFAGQLAIGDVTYGGVQRVFLEQVDGKLQGALYRMTQGLEAGINEVALGPDGDLYLGGIGYDGNWNQPGKLRYGLQKLRANDTVTMDILKTEITETGFKLTYTKPLSEQTRTNLAAKYQVQQWRYNPTAAYGGPKLDQESLAVENATVSADGKTVSLTVDGVKPGRVVHIRSQRPFSAADGEQLWSTEVWYTANAVPGYQSPADQGYYEGEEATILGGASIAADHSKYSGSGFVANLTTVGSGVTFTVNAAQAGPQPVHVRYSNGPNPSVKTKLVSLIVNGTEVDPLALPSTTDWKTWAFATRELNLNAGSNTITLRYDTGDDGWVNVDVLKVGTERDICSPQAAGAGYTEPLRRHARQPHGLAAGERGLVRPPAGLLAQDRGQRGHAVVAGRTLRQVQPEAGLEARRRRQLRSLRRLPGPRQRLERRLHARPRGPDRRHRRRGLHDRLDLQLQRAGRCRPRRGPQPTRAVERVRDHRRRPANPGLPQRRQDQRLHQHRPEPDDRARIHRRAEPRRR